MVVIRSQKLPTTPGEVDRDGSTLAEAQQHRQPDRQHRHRRCRSAAQAAIATFKTPSR